MQLIFMLSSATSVGIGVVLLVLGLVYQALPVFVRFLSIPVIALGVAEWFLWPMLFPRGLKADAQEVAYFNGLATQKMQRSDVKLVFRGQVWVPARAGGSWEKGYAFAGPDGKVGFSCIALWFTEDGIAEFAQRLQVPIKGDFSVRVKDRIDPTSGSARDGH